MFTAQLRLWQLQPIVISLEGSFAHNVGREEGRRGRRKQKEEEAGNKETRKAEEGEGRSKKKE